MKLQSLFALALVAGIALLGARSAEASQQCPTLDGKYARGGMDDYKFGLKTKVLAEGKVIYLLGSAPVLADGKVRRVENGGVVSASCKNGSLELFLSKNSQAAFHILITPIAEGYVEVSSMNADESWNGIYVLQTEEEEEAPLM